ncbi:MAG: hypothetical protein HZB14_02795 [Actinobacteria bacterium]|nr:hypothetical protein [Actinomycetota bacterium]
MARDRDTRSEASEEPGGTLADAINAHLALKREHGADPEAVEQEKREALAPARRDVDSSADLHPAAGSPQPEPVAAAEPEAPTEIVVPEPEAIEPEPEPAPTEPVELEPEPAAPEPVQSEPEPVEPEPEPVAHTPEPAPTPEPAQARGPEPSDADYREDTGTIEFEWGGEADPPEPEPVEPPADSGPDVLEQTPEFFEETPEYDRLWFEERSPREFDF